MVAVRNNKRVADHRAVIQPIVCCGCYHVGDTVTEDEFARIFTGSSDPPGCLRVLEKLVHKAEPSDCHTKPCGVGTVYQPTIDSSVTFYTTGSFRYPLEAIGSINTDGIFVPQTGFEKATEFCFKVCVTHLFKLLGLFNVLTSLPHFSTRR